MASVQRPRGARPPSRDGVFAGVRGLVVAIRSGRGLTAQRLVERAADLRKRPVAENAVARLDEATDLTEALSTHEQHGTSARVGVRVDELPGQRQRGRHRERESATTSTPSVETTRATASGGVRAPRKIDR